MKAIQTNTQFFENCKGKLEMYLKTGKQLKSNHWEDLHVYRNDDDIQFYDGCELIWEFSSGNYQQNLEDSVLWLLAGAKDPLGKR